MDGISRGTPSGIHVRIWGIQMEVLEKLWKERCASTKVLRREFLKELWKVVLQEITGGSRDKSPAKTANGISVEISKGIPERNLERSSK